MVPGELTVNKLPEEQTAEAILSFSTSQQWQRNQLFQVPEGKQNPVLTSFLVPLFPPVTMKNKHHHKQVYRKRSSETEEAVTKMHSIGKENGKENTNSQNNGFPSHKEIPVIIQQVH